MYLEPQLNVNHTVGLQWKLGHLKTVKITSNIFAVCCRLIAGIGKKEKTKEEEEQIKKAPFYGITVHNLPKKY